MAVAALGGSKQGLGSQETWVQLFAFVVSLLLAVLFTLLARTPSTRAAVANKVRWEKPRFSTEVHQWRTVQGYSHIDML